MPIIVPRPNAAAAREGSMRRPHVYERSVPRRRRAEAPPVGDDGEVARRIARALPALIELAEASGLPALAALLGAARDEAERAGPGRG